MSCTGKYHSIRRPTPQMRCQPALSTTLLPAFPKNSTLAQFQCNISGNTEPSFSCLAPLSYLLVSSSIKIIQPRFELTLRRTCGSFLRLKLNSKSSLATVEDCLIFSRESECKFGWFPPQYCSNSLMLTTRCCIHRLKCWALFLVQF